MPFHVRAPGLKLWDLMIWQMHVVPPTPDGLPAFVKTVQRPSNLGGQFSQCVSSRR